CLTIVPVNVSTGSLLLKLLLLLLFEPVALLLTIRREKKVSKDSPKGRVSILSPLEPPQGDQRLCLWKP
ncbi:hypothetical protein, partial [Faecalispora jeddahensis]|uniref:hypothetical protein n=1 Tax=Faecalispora jeddahensis TaxID=1414721 RepID=UPI001A9A720B